MGKLNMMFYILYLKDFYSHSNWVELGNNAPYSTLIRPDQPLENLAGRTLILLSGCRKATLVHRSEEE